MGKGAPEEDRFCGRRGARDGDYAASARQNVWAREGEVRTGLAMARLDVHFPSRAPRALLGHGDVQGRLGPQGRPRLSGGRRGVEHEHGRDGWGTA